MHIFLNKWSHNQLGTETAENCKPRIELDESKIVTFDNQVRWILGFVVSGTKEVLIYYINNDRTKEKFYLLLKIMYIHIKVKLLIIMILMKIFQLKEYIQIVFLYFKN